MKLDWVAWVVGILLLLLLGSLLQLSLRGGESHRSGAWDRATLNGALPQASGPPRLSPDPSQAPYPKSDSLPAYGTYVYIDELPEAITKVAPEFPEIARQAGASGEVLIQVLVGRDGRVAEARVTQSDPMFDEAALAAVKQWTFKPAKTAGKPVPVWVAVPVRFTLH